MGKLELAAAGGGVAAIVAGFARKKLQTLLAGLLGAKVLSVSVEDLKITDTDNDFHPEVSLRVVVGVAGFRHVFLVGPVELDPSAVLKLFKK
jgi:hypothetical protein